MPNVETSTLIDAPLEHVYAIAKDNEKFPEFMGDVKSITPVETEDERIVCDWVGIVPQFMLKVRWRQEDTWDDEAHTCVFKQLSGDYDHLEGTWSFSEVDGKTQFDSVVDYEYNVPTLGALVKKVIHNIVVKNMAGVLEAIKARAESTVPAESG